MLATFSERMLYTFPCKEDKAPLSRRGFKDAIKGVWWPRSPLVGVPTGRRNDFDVLDVDGRPGREWLARNAVPPTRVHYTQRGCHLLFAHAPGLRCSTGRIAEGVDVRAEGGYIIYWPREGLPIEDLPIVEWPEGLLERAKGKSRREVYPNKLNSSLVPNSAVVTSLREALFKLNPVEWRSEGSQESYDAWFRLMVACKAGGISKEDWIEWCVGDDWYANDEDEIGLKWDGVTASHSGALFKALAERGIKYRAGKDLLVGVHLPPPVTAKPTPKPPPTNLRSRSGGLLRWLASNPTGDGLFSASCLFAEMGLTQATTTKLISGNLPSLRKSLGDAEFTYQIARAYAWVAAKVPANV
jgi:hypothetical protein